MVANCHMIFQECYARSRAPSQYLKRRLSVRSRKVSKPRDLYLELSDRYEIWQALRQQCCRCACQISKRYDNLKCQSRGFETLRDLTERRLFRYRDGAQVPRADIICGVLLLVPALDRFFWHNTPSLSLELNGLVQSMRSRSYPLIAAYCMLCVHIMRIIC